MAFRITKSTEAAARRAQAAVSLSEFLISVGVGTLVVLVLVPLTLYSNRTFAGLANYVDLNAKSVLALDQMTRDIRQCVSLTTFAPDQLVLNDGTSATGLTFTYDPVKRTLVRQQGGKTSTLLTECDLLQFSIYQRTPLAGTYDQYPTATAATCKVVAVKFSCSRALLGIKANTESEQQAKIVMRKH